jgi:hypothetical protein
MLQGDGVNSLQGNLKGQEVASEEVQAEFRVLVDSAAGH